MRQRQEFEKRLNHNSEIAHRVTRLERQLRVYRLGEENGMAARVPPESDGRGPEGSWSSRRLHGCRRRARPYQNDSEPQGDRDDGERDGQLERVDGTASS